MRLAGFLLVLCLIGCSPQQRLNKLIRNHPELAKRDTLALIDTVYVEAVRVDSVFHVDRFFTSDTLVIQKDKVRVQIHTIRDSIYIRGECLPDTIIREIVVPYDKFDVETANWIQRNWLLIALLALMCGIIVSFKVRI